MILYRRKSTKEQWLRAPVECMTDKHEAGWDYCYFASDEAANRGTTFN